MKAVALTLVLVLNGGLAVAQTRPDTVSRPCSASQRDVQTHGAIVLGTGGPTYDRFVRDRSFCQFDEVLLPAWVRSRDSDACFVGYRCTNQPPWSE